MRTLTLTAWALALVATACADSRPKPHLRPLVLSEVSDTRLAGRRGDVVFEVDAMGEAGARAVFSRSDIAEGAAHDTAPQTLEVVLHDPQHAFLHYGDVTFDGDGALTPTEASALLALVQSALYKEIPLIGLDTPCATRQRIPPRFIAALLVPFQASLKYLSADRAAEVEAHVKVSSCRYFTELGAKPDTRDAPVVPLLANGQVVPMAFGHLPFDEAGARASSVRKDLEVRKDLKPDTNVYGPGQSMCRGACGPDCEPNNCGEPKEELRCVLENGHNTGDKERYQVYTCGEHEGCIHHDACFDNCNGTFGVGSWDAAFCMRACDLEAAASHGALQGLEWALGEGPFSHEKTYEYGTGERIRDEKMCPLHFGLSVTPNSGIAPLSSKIQWEFDVNESAQEHCRLDPGDGSPAIDIVPCPARGEHAHTFRVPSEMYARSGVYNVTLTRIGTAQVLSTDVQANWRFVAAPNRGKAPLTTQLSWEGFAGVDKPLTCRLNFGDGSAPVDIENCQTESRMSHEYAQVGTYTATLTVRGGDRVLNRAIVIEVKDEEQPGDCSILTQATRFTASATFAYSVSAANDWQSIVHQASATLHGTLTFSHEGGDGISYDDAAPTGNVTYSEHGTIQGKFSYLEQGSGAPLPEGSKLLLNINRPDCTFNLHVQASVAGTTQWVDEPARQTEHWVASLNSEWIPFASGMSGSFAGDYPALSNIDTPELIAFYVMDDFNIVSILGEDKLGRAEVSWQLALEP